MALTKFKLGDLIELVDERNSGGIKNFYGVNINKEFMPTVADTSNLNEKKYKVVRKNRFVFSGMQTGRDKCIRISLYRDDEPIIVSPAYFTFEISATDKILSEYLFMFFQSKEKDRLGWFFSDSSVRSNLDWNVFCDIEIQLPPLEIQKKFVAVYNSMLANQKIYERGLDDLKLVCDGYIEELRRKFPCEKIGKYIERHDKRNSDNKIKNVKGISTSKNFRDPTSKVNRNELSNYKIVKPSEFAFVPVTDTWKVFAFALNDTQDDFVVSQIYEVFSTNEKFLLPEYLAMFFNRSEFDRYARFHSWGSAREVFTWKDLIEVEIPIPDIKIQKSISEMYNTHQVRKKLAEELKLQLRNVCPVLIKGSLNEGERS